jgi:hypothetical protein
MDFERLPKDVLIQLALALRPDDIRNLCASNEKISQLLWDNPEFWVQKLQKDYGVNYYKVSKKKSSQEDDCDESPALIYEKISDKFGVNMDKHVFSKGYPEKLKRHLIETGYVDPFKNQIAKLVGPWYGNRKIRDDKIDEMMDEIQSIIHDYFVVEVEDDCYPLHDAKFGILETYDILNNQDLDFDDEDMEKYYENADFGDYFPERNDEWRDDEWGR